MLHTFNYENMKNAYSSEKFINSSRPNAEEEQRTMILDRRSLLPLNYGILLSPQIS